MAKMLCLDEEQVEHLTQKISEPKKFDGQKKEMTGFLTKPCYPVQVKKLMGKEFSKLHLKRGLAELRRDFVTAPQFAEVDMEQILEQRRNGEIRVILLAQEDYYPRQAATYLASMGRLLREQKGKASQKGDAFWKDSGLLDVADLEEDEDDDDQPFGGRGRRRSKKLAKEIGECLELVKAESLDDSLDEKSDGGGGFIMMGGPDDHVDIRPSALLVARASGAVLTQKVVDELVRTMDHGGNPLSPRDRFVALHPDQVENEFCQQLQLNHGFHVCAIKTADEDYLADLMEVYAHQAAVDLKEGVDLSAAVRHMQQLKGQNFVETDLAAPFDWVIQQKLDGQAVGVEELCFKPSPLVAGKKGMDELDGLIGLSGVKTAVRRIVAQKKLESRRRKAGLSVTPNYHHMAFFGPPGTGKTVCAQLVAKILRENGCGSGRFKEAGREDLVGGFVGHTAPKIKKVFDENRGGVIFIDEVGALIGGDQHSDCYTDEAVNALVYHMDRCPETTVIFATYDGEMKRFLEQNPGLSSRVAQQIHFDSYNDGELYTILERKAEDCGYDLPQGVEAVAADYFRRLREKNPDTFGNGREVRRLLEGAEEEMALRLVDDEESGLELTVEDFRGCVARLMPAEETAKRRIGF